nr:uncharacterized protein LOC117846110 isoform X2 [Setaria viridis]
MENRPGAACLLAPRCCASLLCVASAHLAKPPQRGHLACAAGSPPSRPLAAVATPPMFHDHRAAQIGCCSPSAGLSPRCHLVAACPSRAAPAADTLAARRSRPKLPLATSLAPARPSRWAWLPVSTCPLAVLHAGLGHLLVP